MNSVNVCNIFLWDEFVGSVAYDDKLQVSFFEYDSKFKSKSLEISPLMMPLRGQDIYSFPTLSSETFQGLPGLLADSLPDYFGNQVINTYLRLHGRNKNSFNVIEKLCYIGNRGMGALEFKPALSRERKSIKIDVNDLSQLASEILQQRELFNCSLNDKKGALHDILQIGSSAGGARPKAIIAWNEKTNEVFSGQVKAPIGCEYWLMKFDIQKDNKSYGRIEYAYYLMAKACGINMTDSRLFEDSGYAHFMTKRFDRVNGEKIHVQTLCAMQHMDYNNPLINSYEQAFDCMERLKLLPSEKEQFFRRMVFNTIIRNQDDHTKNIAFMMGKDGVWKLAPAYDVAWAYKKGAKWTGQHQMSINGKRDNFSLGDFLTVAKRFDISKGSDIIKELCDVTKSFIHFANLAQIDKIIAEQMQAEFRLY